MCCGQSWKGSLELLGEELRKKPSGGPGEFSRSELRCACWRKGSTWTPRKVKRINGNTDFQSWCGSGKGSGRAGPEGCWQGQIGTSSSALLVEGFLGRDLLPDRPHFGIPAIPVQATLNPSAVCDGQLYARMRILCSFSRKQD